MKQHSALIIGHYLRMERIKRGLSIDKLASMCQISSSQISVIERGKNPLTGKCNNITLTSLELIGEGLGLSVHDILENSGYYQQTHTIIENKAFFITTAYRQYQNLNTENKNKVRHFISTLLSLQKTHS